jgi:hypothetical protein
MKGSLTKLPIYNCLFITFHPYATFLFVLASDASDFDQRFYDYMMMKRSTFFCNNFECLFKWVNNFFSLVRNRKRKWMRKQIVYCSPSLRTMNFVSAGTLIPQHVSGTATLDRVLITVRASHPNIKLECQQRAKYENFLAFISWKIDWTQFGLEGPQEVSWLNGSGDTR